MADKTNVMRILDKAKIPYTAYEYDAGDGAIDGVSVAHKVGKPVERVYKTLVTQNGHDIYVFVIPVASELNLKKAAKAVRAKAVTMLHVADINKYTGYIRGGCSPIGMKKRYKTVIDSSAKNMPTIVVSGGKIGTQVELSPNDLISQIDGIYDDVVFE